MAPVLEAADQWSEEAPPEEDAWQGRVRKKSQNLLRQPAALLGAWDSSFLKNPGWEI